MRALAIVLLSACTVSTGAALGRPSRPAAPASAAAPAPDAAPAPAAVADAAPAAAAEAVPERSPVPGGRLSRDARTCDAAADHCLRPDTWFLERTVGKMHRIVPVFWADGAWREWFGGTVVEGGPVHRTRAVSFADLEVGMRVLVYGPLRLPPNESEAYGTWRFETVAELDPEDERYAVHEGSIPSFSAEYTRVVVETRD